MSSDYNPYCAADLYEFDSCQTFDRDQNKLVDESGADEIECRAAIPEIYDSDGECRIDTATRTLGYKNID